MGKLCPLAIQLLSRVKVFSEKPQPLQVFLVKTSWSPECRRGLPLPPLSDTAREDGGPMLPPVGSLPGLD